MAIVSKTNRDGVDVVIEGLQQRWYAQLIGFWDTNATYQMYPRANKNYRQDQIIPEVSVDEKDYNEVLTNDKFSITSFFLNNDERERSSETLQITHSISIIFQANLVELYGQTERVDETFNMHVMRVIEKENKYIHGPITITEGVDKVYSDLSLTGELKDSVNMTDISQFHVVKFTFDVIYKPKCNVAITPVCVPGVLMFQGVLAEPIPSGTTLNVLVKDPDGNPASHSYNSSNDTLTVNPGTGAAIDITVNGQAFLDDQTTNVDIPIINSNDDPVGSETIPGTIEISDSQIQINDSAADQLYLIDIPAEGAATQTITDSTVVIKNTAGTTIQTETVKAQASKDATIANVTWTDSDGSSESTVYGGAIMCTPMVNSATVYKSGAVTPILSEDDPSTQFGRGVDWYTLDYNNYFGTTRRFTGKTGGYQSGGSYFSVTGASTTYALAFPDDIVIDWAYWNKRTGDVHWWSMAYFSSTGTNAKDNQPYTLAGKSDWILPNIPMHRTLYNYEFFGVGTMMNYNPFNLGGLATANRLWLSNVPTVTTNLVNFSGTDGLTNNSLGTTCRVQAFRLGNTSEL